MNRKYQLSLSKLSKKGFTLIEIMIVLSLISIFFYATTMFNNNSQTEKQKSDRLVNLIADIIQSENTNMFLGKMPIRNGLTTDRIDVRISRITGIETIYYHSWAFLYSGSKTIPFFDGDENYKIKSIVWTGSSAAIENGNGNSIDIILTQTGMIYTGASITASPPILEITACYGALYSSLITVDRRVGKVEVKHYAPWEN